VTLQALNFSALTQGWTTTMAVPVVNGAMAMSFGVELYLKQENYKALFVSGLQLLPCPLPVLATLRMNSFLPRMQALMYKYCSERIKETSLHDTHVLLHCTSTCDEAFDGFAQYVRGALNWDPDLLYLAEFWNLHKDALKVPEVKKPKNGSAMFRWQQSQVATKHVKLAVSGQGVTHTWGK
jgi:hypothetical protein